MILVFGGGGQLGQALAGLGRDRGVALTALARGEADIADGVAVGAALGAHRPALVVNAGAYTAVDAAEAEPGVALRANAEGPAVLAEACARAGVPLVHLSTDYVFDGTKPGAYVEDDPVSPLGVYGRTKAEGERLVRAAHLRHVILRTSWVYGPHGRNFLRTMLRLAGERDELRIVADQTGCPTSTRSLADAVLRIAPRLARSEAGEAVWGTFHFAGAGATSWAGFAERIVQAAAPVTGRRPRIVPIATADYPTPARRPANSRLDSERFEAVHGVRAARWEGETDRVVSLLTRGGTVSC